jgi:hypothetical protein
LGTQHQRAAGRWHHDQSYDAHRSSDAPGTDQYADVDVYPDTHRYAYVYPEQYCYGLTHGDSHTDCDGDIYPITYVDSITDPDIYGDPNIHENTDIYKDIDIHGDSDIYKDIYPITYVDTD